MEKHRDNLAEQIKELYVVQGLTSTEVARRLNVSGKVVHRIICEKNFTHSEIKPYLENKINPEGADKEAIDKEMIGATFKLMSTFPYYDITDIPNITPSQADHIIEVLKKDGRLMEIDKKISAFKSLGGI